MPEDPPTGFNSPSEFHQSNTASNHRPMSPPAQDAAATRSFQGLSPFSVLPATASHLPRRDPSLIRLCCAPRISHPLSALLPPQPPRPISSRVRSWDSPFGASLLARCRTLSQAPRPSRRWDAGLTTTRTPTSRLSTPRQVPPGGLGVSQTPLRLPPWASPPSRLASAAAGPRSPDCPLPSRASPSRSQDDRAARTSGYLNRSGLCLSLPR
jgi:hypothetical protein